jgi:23S rRNA pseudouridine2605 synthase
LAETGPGQRLQKVLAAAGIGSRRHCERLILDGRVEVDRRIVTELGSRADPSQHEIRVDGQSLPRARPVYYVLNKPAGVVSTAGDPAGRTRVIDLVKTNQRLFTVGRLDRSSEGLILLTNDGALANRLMHPRYGVERVYQVVVAGHPTHETLAKLRRGVHLAEGLVRVARLRISRRHKHSTFLEMVLVEGRNREIRRMAARLGHKVMKLKRIAFGPIRLGQLTPGAYRQLTAQELKRLRALRRPAAEGPPTPRPAGRFTRRGRRPMRGRRP